MYIQAGSVRVKWLESVKWMFTGCICDWCLEYKYNHQRNNTGIIQNIDSVYFSRHYNITSIIMNTCVVWLTYWFNINTWYQKKILSCLCRLSNINCHVLTRGASELKMHNKLLTCNPKAICNILIYCIH